MAEGYLLEEVEARQHLAAAEEQLSLREEEAVVSGVVRLDLQGARNILRDLVIGDTSLTHGGFDASI